MKQIEEKNGYKGYGLDVTFPSGKLFLDQFLGLFPLNSQEFFGIK